MKDTDVLVRYRACDSVDACGDAWLTSDVLTLSAENHHMGVITLTGLTPSTRHFYQVMHTDTMQCLPRQALHGSSISGDGDMHACSATFRTFPPSSTHVDADNPVNIAFGSCADRAFYPLDEIRGYAGLKQLHPDLMLHLGDVVYTGSSVNI